MYDLNWDIWYQLVIKGGFRLSILEGDGDWV